MNPLRRASAQEGGLAPVGRQQAHRNLYHNVEWFRVGPLPWPPVGPVPACLSLQVIMDVPNRQGDCAAHRFRQSSERASQESPSSLLQ